MVRAPFIRKVVAAYPTPGCMIVELLDYRPSKGQTEPLENPTRTRAVLNPNQESLYADFRLLRAKQGLDAWGDMEVLHAEACFLVSMHK
jgi:transcription factor SPT20